MEMKIVSYICAIVTSVFIMIQDSKDYKMNEIITVTDSLVVERPPISQDVEKGLRTVELLKSAVKIEIKEIEIKNINDETIR